MTLIDNKELNGLYLGSKRLGRRSRPRRYREGKGESEESREMQKERRRMRHVEKSQTCGSGWKIDTGYFEILELYSKHPEILAEHL